MRNIDYILVEHAIAMIVQIVRALMCFCSTMEKKKPKYRRLRRRLFTRAKVHASTWFMCCVAASVFFFFLSISCTQCTSEVCWKWVVAWLVSRVKLLLLTYKVRPCSSYLNKFSRRSARDDRPRRKYISEHREQRQTICRLFELLHCKWLQNDVFIQPINLPSSAQFQ